MGEPGDVITDQPSRIPDWMILLRAAHHVIVQDFNIAGSTGPGLEPKGSCAGIMPDGEKVGENNFPDGKGVNFIIEDNVINGNGKVGGGSLNLAGLQDSLIQNNLIYGNFNHGIAQWDDANPYDAAIRRAGPTLPNGCQFQRNQYR